MLEYLKRNSQEKVQTFCPAAGELLSQDFYKHDSTSGLEVLTDKYLLFFEEVGKPDTSWKSRRLMAVVLEKESEHKFDSGLLNFEPVQTEKAIHFEWNNRSSVIFEQNMSMIIYREVTEIGLNSFLYGMARYLKSEQNRFGGSEAARKIMADWCLQIKYLDKILPEEKERILKINKRIMDSWNNIGFWKQINDAGRRNLNQL